MNTNKKMNSVMKKEITKNSNAISNEKGIIMK